MKTTLLRCAILAFTIVAAGCSTGKKAFEKGNYDQAVSLAVNRLQKDPDNDKAIRTLKQAYQFAEEEHQTRIKEISASADIYRWEYLINEYERLNALAESIRRCPACREVVGEKPKYVTQITEAKLKATEARYAQVSNY
ncbi:MAG: hypothetical protein COW65_18220 [Cytophagales bacterium CG18_big_fil_WC_8_21_14_2_50_42_9]|nr:MAG: hypothetical protein COW65_18220 [Cytophagales bacterium CG18_big_fil_WC_8_21_14_2_50_42_9]